MVPNPEECLLLLEKYNVPEHVIAHSRRVGEMATCLCRLLIRRGENLDEAKVVAGAWLHDIAKMGGLESGENHSLAGARLLAGLGFAEIAEIVRQHVVLDPEVYQGPIQEATLVHYADKRVKHTAIVPLPERFQDLKERYGKTPEALSWLINLEDRTLDLEKRIFRGLSISPEDLKTCVEEGESGCGVLEALRKTGEAR